jgi:hypothetical protein
MPRYFHIHFDPIAHQGFNHCMDKAESCVVDSSIDRVIHRCCITNVKSNIFARADVLSPLVLKFNVLGKHP